MAPFPLNFAESSVAVHSQSEPVKLLIGQPVAPKVQPECAHQFSALITIQ
jgi:hypothetical protein